MDDPLLGQFTAAQIGNLEHLMYGDIE